MSRQRIMSKRRSESDIITQRKKSERRSRESRQLEKTIRRQLSLDRNIHIIRLSNYSRKLKQTLCALSCALLLLSLALFLLSLASSLLLLLSLAALSRACLKRPCSRSQPKTEADDVRIGVYIMYIYIYRVRIRAHPFE